MSKVKTYTLGAVVLVTIVGMMAFAIGCGSSGGSSSSASPTAVGGSAMERATAILGHAPTGLAKTIVDRGSVIVSTDANYPPQSSVDQATGKLVGFDVDVAKAMAKVLDLAVDFKTVQWETIPTGLQTGKWEVSIGSMTPTPERVKSLGFTKPYYYVSAQVLCKIGGEQIAGAADLNGKKVGVCAATTYYDYLKKNTKAIVKAYSTDADTFPDLANGNLDFVLTAGPTGKSAIAAGQPFEFSGKPLSYDDCCFAVKLGEPDWLSMLEYAVQTMHQDGSLTAMSKQWYNGMDLTVKQ